METRKFAFVIFLCFLSCEAHLKNTQFTLDVSDVEHVFGQLTASRVAEAVDLLDELSSPTAETLLIKLRDGFQSKLKDPNHLMLIWQLLKNEFDSVDLVLTGDIDSLTSSVLSQNETLHQTMNMNLQVQGATEGSCIVEPPKYGFIGGSCANFEKVDSKCEGPDCGRILPSNSSCTPECDDRHQIAGKEFACTSGILKSKVFCTITDAHRVLLAQGIVNFVIAGFDLFFLAVKKSGTVFDRLDSVRALVCLLLVAFFNAFTMIVRAEIALANQTALYVFYALSGIFFLVYVLFLGRQVQKVDMIIDEDKDACQQWIESNMVLHSRAFQSFYSQDKKQKISTEMKGDFQGLSSLPPSPKWMNAVISDATDPRCNFEGDGEAIPPVVTQRYAHREEIRVTIVVFGLLFPLIVGLIAFLVGFLVHQ